MPYPTIVTDPQTLATLVEHLKTQPRIALDTESNSFHSYSQSICLLQISTGQGDWLIDPLALSDLSPLAPVMSDPAIEKIFHAADNDIAYMKRDFHFTFQNIFDTQFAARILGIKTLGLGTMVQEYFGVTLEKKYQRADWAIRPLPLEQVRYAQQDTQYLFALRDLLYEQLVAKNAVEEAQEAFAFLADLPAMPASQFDPEGYWYFHEVRELDPQHITILRELYLWRENLAQKWDKPVFKVMSNEVLMNIARNAPVTLAKLTHLDGLSGYMKRRYWREILQAVERGLHATPVSPPKRPRIDRSTLIRYNALHDWRKMQALERGVESDVILPKDILWSIAQQVPKEVGDFKTVAGFGPWKQKKYGAAVLDVLSQTHPQTLSS